ncbi:unnamed protein product [Rotaria socialis]|uniref:Uncharacterized protein n=1 Tax=Rotaria socialis TaxID=392032 RepID=A0A820J7T7_9BILA|nr:unnamed protein product [Rotaria socialis]
MGKFDLVEKYYRRWLSKLPSNDPSLCVLHQRLGVVADDKGEYDTSLKWYQKSLETKMRTHRSYHVNIGNTHNSIIAVHRNKDKHTMSIAHMCPPPFYNNIGNIYQEENKYFEALDFNEKSLDIHEKHLPADHPDMGGSYNNIGIVHHCLGHYGLALNHYNRSLKIRLKSLPGQHSDIAMAYRNMGPVYEYRDELEQALIYMKKAQTIYEVALPFNYPNVVNIKDDVKRVEDKLKMKKKN